jgi:hypothetical protein
MKKSIIIFTSIVMLMSWNICAQDSVLTENTAFTVPKGRIEFGIMNPFTWGITDKIQLSSHPVMDILLPNISCKVNWLQIDYFYLASVHELNYPSLLLGTIAREGTGGILAPDNDIPNIFCLYNHAIGTLLLDKHIFSLKAGINAALSLPDTNFETIDYPLIYGNTAVYHSHLTVDIVIDYKTRIYNWLHGMVSLELLLIPEPLSTYEVRQTTKALFVLGKTFSIMAGYTMVAGEYPYGSDWKIIPLIDTLFSFGGRK